MSASSWLLYSRAYGNARSVRRTSLPCSISFSRTACVMASVLSAWLRLATARILPRTLVEMTRSTSSMQHSTAHSALRTCACMAPNTLKKNGLTQ